MIVIMNNEGNIIDTKSVFAAITGRPNVGKSSLLNLLVGEKAAIVTPKPQTTRTRVTGILTKGAVQFVFLDTPGFHTPRTKLGQRMTRAVTGALSDVDAAVMVLEPGEGFTEAEAELIDGIKSAGIGAVAVVNKIDTVKDSAALAARVAEIEKLDVFARVLKTSAVEGTGAEELLGAIAGYAEDGPHYFPDDAYTDSPERELVAEILREKLLFFMSDEIPHGTAVEIDKFKEREGAPIIDIDAVIYCEKKSHKGMIIGKGGQMLKKIASAGRKDAEEMLGCKVNLQCWVKIREDWRDNDRLLDSMGFKA